MVASLQRTTPMAPGTCSIKHGQEHKRRGHNLHSTASPQGERGTSRCMTNLEEELVTSKDGSGIDASPGRVVRSVETFFLHLVSKLALTVRIPSLLDAGPSDKDATEPHETQAPLVPVKEQTKPASRPAIGVRRTSCAWPSVSVSHGVSRFTETRSSLEF